MDEGHALNLYDPSQVAQNIERLRRENQQLQNVIRDLQRELADQKNDVQRSINALKSLQQVLAPLHRSLRAVFGEIEAGGVDANPYGPSPSAAPSHVPQDAKWQPWIEKWKGTKKAVVIQTLLEHGPLTRTQLRSATESGWSTIDAVTAQLQNLGLITKENEKWTLKN